MKKKILLSVLCICMVLTMMPTVGYGATRAAGEAPKFDNTINYCIWADGTTTSKPQIELTNYDAMYFTNGTWRFYTAPTGGTEVIGIRGRTDTEPMNRVFLYLTVEGTVPAGNYWASFTPSGNSAESPRGSFTLKKLPELEFKQSTVYKTEENQSSVTVDLVGDYPSEHTDWVVKATTAGNADGTGTSWGHPQQLVLTSSYDAIKKGTYDISYKIYGKESNKVKLTIDWSNATVSIKTKTYLLDWNAALEITKEDGSQKLETISYQVGNGPSVNITDYTISQDGKTVSFTKEKIAGIVGANIGEGKEVEVSFIFNYTGGPSGNNDVTQKILVRKSAKKNVIKWEKENIWEKGNGVGLGIETLGPTEQVRRIFVDGKMISFDGNTQDGNVFNDESIKISPEYLETLEIGSYTIRILYEDSIEKEFTTGTTSPIKDTEWTSYSEDTFKIVNKRDAEATPNATIDYVNEKLTGLVTNAAYSITPSDGTAITIKADTNGKLSIDRQWLGKELSIIKTGNGEITKDSEAQILSIPAKPATPAVPTATNIKDDSITLTALEGAKYKINNGTWQSNPNFTGLEANTKYSFYQRIKAVDGVSFQSDISAVKDITTDKTTLTVTAPAADGIYGQPLSELNITGEVVTDKEVKVVGTWKFNAENASGIFPAVSGGTSYTATFTPNANVDKYKTLEAEITPRINYLDTKMVATIADTNKGTNDWYKGTATVNAPSGYYININQDITSFGMATSLEINETKDLTYYLREISTGKISSEKTLAIKIDKTKPTILDVISSAIKDVSATVTVTGNDIESGIKNYYIYISTSNIDNVSAATIKKDGKSNTTGVFNLTLLKALTKYNFAVLATDNATNESNITKGNFTTLGAPTPPTPTPTPVPTPDPTAPIQPKEHTITNADGTKTTVILFDGTKSGTPAKGEALLSAEALSKIAAVKGAGAVVATSTSIVQFDQKALEAITGGQTKGNIKVIAEIVSKDTLTPEQKALLGDNALIIDLSVENENGKVTDFNGGTATVVIKIPAGVDPNTLGAVYIKTNGKLEKVEGKVVMVNGVATFQFVTNHFSKFAVLDKATIDKAIAAQEATAKDKLVKGVKATKLTAIKAVAKKSNVTVTWKKSKGYKVDGYQIWKSSKKTTGYKMMAKRTGQKYKNTYGLKAGKTYYYKVRGFREIDGKIVYTKWAQAKVVAK